MAKNADVFIDGTFPVQRDVLIVVLTFHKRSVMSAFLKCYICNEIGFPDHSYLASISHLKECAYCGEYFCRRCEFFFEDIVCCLRHSERLNLCSYLCMSFYRCDHGCKYTAGLTPQ